VHWLLLVATSTNFHVIVVSPRPKVDGRTAVPVMSLSQLSFAFGAVILRAMRQGVVANLGGDWLDCVAVNYWRRFVLNTDYLLSALGAVALAPSTNFQVMVVSPRPKVDGRTAVPVMSLSQLSFAFGAVIFRAMRQALSLISAVIGLISLNSQLLAQIYLTLLCAECIGCCWWLHQRTSK
jgi:hypothetical protein